MKSHVFFGKRYRIEELPEDHADRGLCDAPDTKEKAISIRKGLAEKERLEILVHEALHACSWYWDEEGVELSAEDISAFLWRDGWRRSRPSK